MGKEGRRKKRLRYATLLQVFLGYSYQIDPDSGHSDGEPGPVIGRFTGPSEVCFSASTVGDLF